MKSKTTTYLLLITFCILFVYVFLQKRQKEGLKMKAINKKFKAARAAQGFALSLFSMGIGLLLALFLPPLLPYLIYVMVYFLILIFLKLLMV